MFKTPSDPSIAHVRKTRAQIRTKVHCKMNTSTKSSPQLVITFLISFGCKAVQTAELNEKTQHI